MSCDGVVSRPGDNEAADCFATVTSIWSMVPKLAVV